MINENMKVTWNRFKDRALERGIWINKFTSLVVKPEEADGIIKLLENSDLIYSYKSTFTEARFYIEGHQKALVDMYELVAVYIDLEEENGQS